LQGEGQEFESPRLHQLEYRDSDQHDHRSCCGHPLVSGPEKHLETTDQRIAGPGAGERSRVAARRCTLPSEHVDRKIESLYQIFDFCRNQGDDPDTSWHLPMGELLRGVKLHRARGGCLGTKSR
jgi:hypothetical protein